MYKISVIIPVYNSSRYLEENIASIRNQTYRYWEAIYVDDGSTDGSREIIKRAALKDDRIQLIEASHGGVSRARNLGLDIATGDLISFVDSDDRLASDAYEKMINNLCDDYLLCFSYKTFGKESLDRKDLYDKVIEDYTSIISNETIAINMYYFYNMAVVTSLWNKLLWNKLLSGDNTLIRFNPELFSGEDGVFVLAYLSKVKGVKLLPESLYEYRIYGNQSINKHYKHFARNYMVVYNALRAWVYEYSGSFKAIEEFSERWISFLERASWEMDWRDEIEIKEFIIAITSEQTTDSLRAIRERKTQLRIDKSIFVHCLRMGNFNVLKQYGKLFRLLRRIG